MINSKLVTILRTFSKGDMKEFDKLVQSPFFSTGRNLSPFLNALKKYYPGFDNVNLSEEIVFRKLYPGRKFNKTVIDKLRGDLTKLSIEFLRQTALKENKLQSEILLSNMARKKGLTEFAGKIISDCELKLRNNKIKKNYYAELELILGSKDKLIFISDLKSNISYEIMRGDFLTKKFLYLAAFCFVNFRHYRVFYKMNIEDSSFLKFIDSLNLEKFISQNKFDESAEDIFFQINIYIILSWKYYSKDDLYFQKLKELIFKYFKFFDSGLGNSIIINLKYLITSKMRNNNEEKYKLDIFELNNFCLNNDCFIVSESNRFPKKEFVTYFLSGFELEKYKWAKDFVINYSKHLSKEEFDDGVNYCKAQIAFAERDFDLSLNLISKLSLKDDYEKVFTYFMKAAIYYEKKYYVELNSLLEAYFKFLKRDNKVRQDRIKLHFNFISCLKNLLKYQDHKDKNHIYKIEKMLSSKDNKTIMTGWLKKKLIGIT